MNNKSPLKQKQPNKKKSLKIIKKQELYEENEKHYSILAFAEWNKRIFVKYISHVSKPGYKANSLPSSFI